MKKIVKNLFKSLYFFTAIIFCLRFVTFATPEQAKQMFAISFNANGGNGSMEKTLAFKDEQYELPAPSFTNPGYNFIGWKDQHGKTYTLPTTISIKEALTLSAIWKEIGTEDITLDITSTTNTIDEASYETNIEKSSSKTTTSTTLNSTSNIINDSTVDITDNVDATKAYAKSHEADEVAVINTVKMNKSNPKSLSLIPGVAASLNVVDTYTEKNNNTKNKYSRSSILTHDVTNTISEVVRNMKIEVISDNNSDKTYKKEEMNKIQNEIIEDLKSRIYPKAINMTFLTPIKSTDYIFEFDEFSSPAGIKILKTSDLAKVLLKDNTYSYLYESIDGDDYHIRLINGFYCVEYLGSEYFYALDNEGRVVKGLVASRGQEYVTLKNSGEFGINKTNLSNIYYGHDVSGARGGMFWCSEVTFGKFLYNFDAQGRLESVKIYESKNYMIPALEGTWEYKPETSSWFFYQVDEEGNKNYLHSGFYKIKSSDGKKYYYLFDIDGKMQTGLTDYNGSTYYFTESGKNIGVMYIGNITINGTSYTFDEDGKMVNNFGKKKVFGKN